MIASKMRFNKYLYFSASILIAVGIFGCGQVGPSNPEIMKMLQANLPTYLTVENISFEKKENIGTESDPNIQGRFKAVIKLKEDTFEAVFRPDLRNIRNISNVTFVRSLEKKDKTVDLYGVALSKRYNDSWQTDFKPDSNPIAALGKPRRLFNSKTILANSSEEKQLLEESKKQDESDRKDMIAKLLSAESYGFMRGENTIFGTDFNMKFSLSNPDAKVFSGQLKFRGGVVRGFNGTLSNTELKFTVDRYIQGKDSFGLGTVFTIPLDRLEPKSPIIEGKWNQPDGRTGVLQINEF